MITEDYVSFETTMKTTSEIIAYLEGRLVELEKIDPKPRDAYVIEELVAYIKSGKDEIGQRQPKKATPNKPATKKEDTYPNSVCALH